MEISYRSRVQDHRGLRTHEHFFSFLNPQTTTVWVQTWKCLKQLLNWNDKGMLLLSLLCLQCTQGMIIMLSSQQGMGAASVWLAWHGMDDQNLMRSTDRVPLLLFLPYMCIDRDSKFLSLCASSFCWTPLHLPEKDSFLFFLAPVFRFQSAIPAESDIHWSLGSLAPR